MDTTTKGLFIIAFVINFSFPASGVYKRWIGNTNFENGDNWDVGREPCSQDTIIFPDSVPPIFVQTNISVIEMILPSNGEFVLGDMVSLGAAPIQPVTSEKNTPCVGQDVHFNRTEPLSWLDPLNWCEVTSIGGDCLIDQPTRLDTERIPCSTDDVIFPTGHTFYVTLDREVDIYVNSLNLNGKQYNTETFNEYLNTPEGRETFVRLDGYQKTTVNIQGNKCDDITGCSCGNGVGQLRKKICDESSQLCPEPQCNDPVDADGQCCGICGAVIQLDYGFGFKYQGLKERITQEVIKDESKYVDMVVSKTSSNKIQVVVMDRTGGNIAGGVGKNIAKYIDKDIRGARKLGFSHIELRTSGQSKTGPQAITGGREISGSSIAGIVVAIIILLAIVGLAMFCFIDKDRCRRDRLPSFPKSFRRFSGTDENKNEDLELQVGDSVSFKDIISREPEAGFDNPMYGAGIHIQNGKQEKVDEPNGNTIDGPAILDPTDVTFVRPEQGDAGFSNPLYDQTKKSGEVLQLNPVYSEEGIEEDSQI